MGFTVGQGQLAFFSKAIVTPGEGAERTTARLEIVRHGAGEATVVPICSIKFFPDYLEAAATLLGNNPDDIESLVVRHCLYEQDTTVEHFQVRLIGIAKTTRISCKTKVKSSRVGEVEKDNDALPFGKKLKNGAEVAGNHVLSSKTMNKIVGRVLAESNSEPSDAASEPSQISSDDDGKVDGDAASEGTDYDDLDREEWNAVGIKEYDLAPTAAAKCFICDQACSKGQYRLAYRRKQTKLLSDQRRFHPECAHQLPVDTRRRDRLFLKRLLKDDTLEPAARTLLGGVFARMA